MAILAAALGIAIPVLAPAPAAAQTGGASVPGSETPTYEPPGKAYINSRGKAIAPPDAPEPVVRAIQAGNRIRKKPYLYGGGHGSWWDNGYDCSGAVSYVLHAAGWLNRPRSSGGLKRWGKRGRGRWITVFAHNGHTYAVIAGLRWDTSPMGYGKRGPRWRKTKRSSQGFKRRHWRGY